MLTLLISNKDTVEIECAVRTYKISFSTLKSCLKYHIDSVIVNFTLSSIQ